MDNTNTDNNPLEDTNTQSIPPQDTQIENTSKMDDNENRKSSINTIWRNPNIADESDNPNTKDRKSNSTNKILSVKFRVSDAIKFAWKESLGNLGNFFLIIAAFAIAIIIINLILGTTPTHGLPVNTFSTYYITKKIILEVIILCIGTVFTIGMYRVSIEIYNGGKASFKIFFNIKNIILRFIGGEIVALICVGLLYIALFISIVVM